MVVESKKKNNCFSKFSVFRIFYFIMSVILLIRFSLYTQKIRAEINQL